MTTTTRANTVDFAQALPPNHSAFQQLGKGDNHAYQEAAEAFLDGLTTKTFDQRLTSLVSFLQTWSTNDCYGVLPYAFGGDSGGSGTVNAHGGDDDASRRICLTAAICARAPPSLFQAFVKLVRCYLSDDGHIRRNYSLFQNLKFLGWLKWNGLLQMSFDEALHAVITKKVQGSVRGHFDEPYLNVLLFWSRTKLEPWIKEHDAYDAYTPAQWRKRLADAVRTAYIQCRLDQIFEVIADYPDSHVAVTELGAVVRQQQQHLHLPAFKAPPLVSAMADKIRAALVRRLCHPGATTLQIIDVYIATIKVLRVLDPTDRLLTHVAEPIRHYLQSRSDTVRCIISSLTTDPSKNNNGGESSTANDLYEELRRQGAKPLEYTYDSEDEEEPPDMNWQPPPSLHSQGMFLQRTGATAPGNTGGDGDILAMLVSIYGSKELFVNEYRNMLADKLLQSLDYNTDQQVHTLELLKLRFGETSMRNCEVMIKDMEDSKRANGNIKSDLLSATPVDAAMVSHIFWPGLPTDTVVHHERLQRVLDEFGNAYAKLKNPRKLVWHYQLGTVQLELQVLQDLGPPQGWTAVTKDFTCSPLQATLISHFEDKPQWTAEELSNETGAPEHVVQKRMTFWINHRVVRRGRHVHDGRSVYELATPDSSLAAAVGASPTDDDAEEMDNFGVTQEDEMEVYQSYIIGMLRHLGQLPLRTIHTQLKAVVAGSDLRYNKTPQQLNAYLQRLCREERLECGPDGMYKLFKK